MILKTDFQGDGAGNLVDYIQRDRSPDAVNTVDLRNPAGRELSEAEVEQFVEKSRKMGFQRHVIVSPDPNGQYTPEEVGANTRELMNREVGHQPTTSYAYAVHRDTEFPHAHVAVTGRQQELEMGRDELTRLRERASEIYNEPERAQEATPTGDQAPTRTPSETVPAREELHERELEMEEHPEKEVLRTTERAGERAPSDPPAEAERDEKRTEPLQAEPRPEREAELEPEPEPEPEPELEREQDWMMGG